MISIRKYLDGKEKNRAVEPGSPAAATGRSSTLDSSMVDPSMADSSMLLSGLCSTLLDYVGVYVLTGEFDKLRDSLRDVKTVVQPDLTAELAGRVDDSVRNVLASYNTSSRETLQNAAIEMQQIFGVLSQALTALAGGTERSVSRLQKIQETLQRTSTIQDVATLRASLADAVQLIREESVKETHAAARERETFATEVAKVRELLTGNPNRKLPGRSEGVRTVTDTLNALLPGNVLYVIAFTLDQLKAIVQRYGPQAMDDLFLQVMGERLQPIASSHTAYRWTPASLVGVFQRTPDLNRMKSEMANLNRSPLVYRMALGNRTAVLKVGLSHLVAEALPGGADTLIAEIDSFTHAELRGAA